MNFFFKTYLQWLNAVDKLCTPYILLTTQVWMKKDRTLPRCRLSQGTTEPLHSDGLCCILPKDHQESSAIHTPTWISSFQSSHQEQVLWDPLSNIWGNHLTHPGLMGQPSQRIFLRYDLKRLVSKVGLRKPLVVFEPYHQLGDQDYLL